VEFPIGIRLELMTEEPSMLFGKLCSLHDHACSLSSLGSDNDLGTQHAHKLPTLYREGLRHGNDAFVTPILF
jgi:hypothetical protein